MKDARPKSSRLLKKYEFPPLMNARKSPPQRVSTLTRSFVRIQPICFENAIWAYTVGCAIAIKKGCVKAADAAAAIGEGLQSFCIPGSVAENRKVGLGHGNLGKMLLSEETECFCFLAGHESLLPPRALSKSPFNANKVRNKDLAVILNGLGKDAALYHLENQRLHLLRNRV